MKAQILIKENKFGKFYVVIDNGYGNELAMTDMTSKEYCQKWIKEFLKMGIDNL